MSGLASLVLLISAVLGCLASASEPAAGRVEASEAARALAKVLWAKQRDDGSFGSEQYAYLSSGQALTPVLLRQLMQAPGSEQQAVERALDWIRSQVDAVGCLGVIDGKYVEYPVYATASALACLKFADAPEDEGRRRRLVDWLVTAQYDEGEGFGPDHPAHGLWGFTPAQAGRPGFLDIAHTRWVMDALVDDLPESNRHALARALALLQKRPEHERPQPRMDGQGVVDGTIPYDGGFYFSPVALAANKAGGVGDDALVPASYGPPTADGLLVLVSIDTEKRWRNDAWQWLARHPGWGYPAAIPAGMATDWRSALRCYHFASRARATALMDPDGPWRLDFLRALGELRRVDGMFANPPGFLMKEDDPMIASALVLEALVAATD